MPTRNYRIILQNHTDFPMTLINAHLCHGEWTNGGWSPPQRIEAQNMGQWQSESSGIFTGTEGWVKYSLAVEGSDDKGRPFPSEQVYVYWSNPYIGVPNIPPDVTGYNSEVKIGDVKPDCDAPSNGGESGSAFTTPGQHQHELFFQGAGDMDAGGGRAHAHCDSHTNLGHHRVFARG